MDKKLRLAVFGLLVLFLSCEDPSEIGLVLTPDDQIGVFFKDFHVNVATTLIDSIDSRTVDEFDFPYPAIFGRYQNAQFGTIKARLNSQFVPQDIVQLDTNGLVIGLPFEDDAEYVSCNFRIVAPTYNSLDFTRPQTIGIYRVHEDIDEERIYYTKDTVSTIHPLLLQPDLLGSYTFDFVPKPDTTDQLDITFPLSDEFGMQLFEAGTNTIDQNGIYGSYSNFKQTFKGLSIVPDNQNNAIFGMELNNLVNGIEIRYAVPRDTTFDTLSYHYPLYYGSIERAAGFNSFEVDRTGTPLDGLEYYEDFDNDNGIAYAQAGSGVAIRLDFDSMITFFEDFELLKINRAEIVMEGVMGYNGENVFEIPSVLFYNYTDFNNLFVTDLDTVSYSRRFDDAISVLQFQNEILAPSSEFLIAELEGEDYVTLTTLYTQAIMEGFVKDFDFMALPVNYKASFNHFTVRKEDIRLRVYYTTFVD